MQWLYQFPKQAGIYYITAAEQATFEDVYLQVRGQEGRVYADEVVQQLPKLPSTHPQYQEWQWRLWTLDNFFKQTTFNAGMHILDLGCGNGWFTRHVATQSKASVLGMDINQAELQQGARLFSTERCHFAYGDIFEAQLPQSSFDKIILNACVQYFPDLTALVNRLRELLRADGEIHILDSPFYDLSAIPAAKARTYAYYQEQQVTNMQAFYHHHSWTAVQDNGGQVQYQAQSWRARLQRRVLKKGSPFPWVTFT